MRLYLILLMLAVMLSSYSSAATQSVFDGWVIPNKIEKTSDGRTFSIAPNDDDSKIAVTFAVGGTIVDKDDCRSFSDLSVCYDDVAFSHYNYSLPNRIVNKYKISISAEVAKINLSRGFGKLNPSIGEQTAVTANFLNTGNIDVEASFYDNYSSAFEVFLSSPECELFNNVVSWRGMLKSLQEASCSYIIKPLNKTVFTSTAYVEYIGLGGKKETSTAVISISDYALGSAKLFPVSIAFDNDSVLEIRLRVLENLSTSSYTVIFPKGLRIREYNMSDGWSYSGNSFSHSGKMDTEKEYLLKVTVRAEGLGNQTITENIKFTKGNLSSSYTQNSTIEIMHTPPYARLNENNVSIENSELHFFVINPSASLFYNATLSLDSKLNLAQKTFLFDQIPAFGHRDFKVSFNSSPGNYSITAHIDYSTKYGGRADAVSITSVLVSGSQIATSTSEPSLAQNSKENRAIEELQPAKKEEAVSQPLQDIVSTELKKIPAWLTFLPILFGLLIVVAFIFIRRRRGSV